MLLVVLVGPADVNGGLKKDAGSHPSGRVLVAFDLVQGFFCRADHKVWRIVATRGPSAVDRSFGYGRSLEALAHVHDGLYGRRRSGGIDDSPAHR